MEEVFVDGVLGAGFSKGVVRIKFFALDVGQEVRQEPRVGLVMSVEGFLEIQARFAEVTAQLKKAGLVKELPRPESQGGKPGPEPSPGVSPNFA